MTAEPRRIACVDFGATGVRVEILDFCPQEGVPQVETVTRAEFETTKSPNDPERDYTELYRQLWPLWLNYGFEAIVVGFAARVGRDGTIGKGGSLNWDGRNLKGMLEEDFDGVSVYIANDAVMFAAYELVFGVLSGPEHKERNFLVLIPGTGVGTCLVVWTKAGWILLPSEGQHNPYGTHEPTGCNCNTACLESFGGGVAFERLSINPALLDDGEYVTAVTPALGALVASYVRMLPSHLDLVVVSGDNTHKRQPLTVAIEKAANADLLGYVDLPEVVRGSNGAGGVKGCLAYWVLQESKLDV